MATVSSLGIGSGLDLNTLLAGLKTAEQAPLAALQTKQASYSTKLTAYGQLNGALSALQIAAAALAKPELFQGVKASSSATDVLTGTAQSTATSGTYSVNVTQLSQAQSLATAGVDSVTKFNAGTVKFEFGTVSTTAPTGFTADGTARNGSIDIAAKSSLADIAKAINANTTLGATASVINNGDPAKPNQLVLTSKQTGEKSIMQITVLGDLVDPTDDPNDPASPRNPVDTALSDLLMYDPMVAAPNSQMHQTAAALNTVLTVNGIGIVSANNTVAGAIQDTTMTVSKIGLTTLSVQNDTASVQGAVANFVSAYNSLQSVAGKLTAFDPSSKTGAVLLGDSTLRNIQAAIHSALGDVQTAGSGGFKRLSEIGVTLEKDGTLAIDSTTIKLTNRVKLADVLGSNMSEVATLFSGTKGAGGYSGGIGAQFSSLLTAFTDTSGTLTAATKGLNTTLELLGKQYTAMSERADTAVARYKAQFTRLDMMMSSMNQTSSYLTQQFAALNNTNNN